MDEYNNPELSNGTGIISPQHSLDNLVNQAGLKEAINQENAQNAEGRVRENYQEHLAGEFEPELEMHPDEFTDFAEEDHQPKKKVRKRHNDSKKRITELNEEKKAERLQKEEALIRAEIAEREAKRLEDQVIFLSLSAEKQKLEQNKEEVYDIWADAQRTGDVETFKQADSVLRKLQSVEEQKQYEINEISNRYNQYYEQEQQDQDSEAEIEQIQEDALLEFSDRRELESPLYEGFLGHHDFLSPYSSNYDARLVEKVLPVKEDLIQELKLNGQSDEIGTADYFEELSRRIHDNLNPRMRKAKERPMSNDPRYRQPQYVNPQTYQQPQYYEEPVYHQQAPVTQRQYYPHNPQAQQQHQSVAPVNRAGYGTDFHNDPRNIQLDSLQRDTIRDLLAPAITDLSQKVHGRTTDIGEVENIYRNNLMKRYGGY